MENKKNEKPGALFRVKPTSNTVYNLDILRPCLHVMNSPSWRFLAQSISAGPATLLARGRTWVTLLGSRKMICSPKDSMEPAWNLDELGLWPMWKSSPWQDWEDEDQHKAANRHQFSSHETIDLFFCDFNCLNDMYIMEVWLIVWPHVSVKLIWTVQTCWSTANRCCPIPSPCTLRNSRTLMTTPLTLSRLQWSKSGGGSAWKFGPSCVFLFHFVFHHRWKKHDISCSSWSIEVFKIGFETGCWCLEDFMADLLLLFEATADLCCSCWPLWWLEIGGAGPHPPGEEVAASSRELQAGQLGKLCFGGSHTATSNLYNKQLFFKKTSRNMEEKHKNKYGKWWRNNWKFTLTNQLFPCLPGPARSELFGVGQWRP